MLDNNELIAIAKLAHTFKGLSANLGAKELSGSAMRLEHIADLGESEQANAISAFATHLATLIEELEPLLARMNAESNEIRESKAPFSNQERAELIDALSEMVNEQKMEAYDKALEAAEQWPDTLGKVDLDALIENLDLFEFEAAKKSIEAIRQEIP